MTAGIKTPVALLVYNRPEATERVFNRIATVRPRRLLVIADGPKDAADAAKCDRVRSLVEDAPWDCDVERNYADSNMGCRERVVSGLNWVFDGSDTAIVLEDDCLPDSSFFRFCDDLLAFYADNPRIGHISGSNLAQASGTASGGRNSYYFSRYSTIWGWATWRRAWRLYDADLGMWPEVRSSGGHYDLFRTAAEAEYWAWYWDAVKARDIDTWDVQWLFCMRVSNSLAAIPNVNLVTNIGFGKEATHTRDSGGHGANMPAETASFPLHHPASMVCNEDADDYFARQHLLLGRKKQKGLSEMVRARIYGARTVASAMARRLLGSERSRGRD